MSASPSRPHAEEPDTARSHGVSVADPGKKLYARRKQIPEPVFGIISQRLLPPVPAARPRPRARRVEPCDMAWNLKRMFVLRPA